MPGASAFADVGSDIAEVISTGVGEGLGKGLDPRVVPDLSAATVCRSECRLDLDRVEDELVCLECADPGINGQSHRLDVPEALDRASQSKETVKVPRYPCEGQLLANLGEINW